MADGLLDVEALLAPLAEGEGAGVDLREDWSPGSPYQKLRDARSEARAEERARDAEGDVSAPAPEGWRVVRRVAEEVIATRSKDFEVAAWLTEAMVRLDGLPGLAAAARLLAGLVETHWEAGFPRPDEDGMEGRTAPLGGLSGGDADGTLLQALRRSPLLRRADGSELSLYLYEQALETAGLADEGRRQQRFEAGVPQLEIVEAEARLEVPRLRRVAATARSTREAWRAFEAALEAKLGYDGPPTRRVAEVLERLAQVADTLAGGPEEVAEDAFAAAAADAPEGAAAAAAGGSPGVSLAAAVASREDALRQLERIADFFRRTEPHSPLAYTLEDAVRRGRMSLPELLAEVMPDESTRHAMLTSLGIRPREADGG